MLNRMFVVSSATLTSTGTAVSCMVPFDTTCMKMPTQIVVKATGQGAYVRLSNDASVATNADVLVQGGDHVVLSVNGRQYVSVLSDGASSTVSIGALSTGVWGDAMSLSTVLFGAGQQGVWYDPSDSSTIFSDTAGTTPSPTPGAGALSVVGLMLDKSQNGVGTNGAYRYNLLTFTEQFDNAAWTPTALNTTGTPAWVNVTTAPDGTNTADKLIATAVNSSHSIAQTVGTGLFVFSFYAKAAEYSAVSIANNPDNYIHYNLATGQVSSAGTGWSSGSMTSVGNGWWRCVGINAVSKNWVFARIYANNAWQSDGNNATGLTFTGDGTSGVFVWGAQLTTASAPTTYQRITADWYSTMAGNHAISYNTTTARPELSARVNLLTYSEQFDNAAWTKDGLNAFGSGSVANTSATTDPLGGNTADYIQENTALSKHRAYQALGSSGVSYAFSCYLKAGQRTWAYLNFGDIANRQAWFDLANGVVGTVSAGLVASIQAAGNGWYRCTITRTASAVSPNFDVGIATADNVHTYTGDGTSGIFIWGADLRPANIGTSVPAYQRIADAYTYDSSGFPRYLVFNGTASGMYTPANLNLSGTDKATVFAGVRKISDAAGGVVAELSASVVNPGTFLITASPSATARYQTSFSDSASLCTYQPQTFTAPISNVVDASFDLSAGSISTAMVPRVNTVVRQDNASGTKTGSGNFVSSPLNIGARNAQSGTPTAGTFLNGYIYSLIVVGAASTAAQITSTESWINVKEGGVY